MRSLEVGIISIYVGRGEYLTHYAMLWLSLFWYAMNLEHRRCVDRLRVPGITGFILSGVRIFGG